MIVCIEDDKNIREMLEYSLETLGWEVVTYEDATSFFNSNVSPQIILLDLILPDLNGKKVLKRIRENSDVPVIIITANNYEIEKIRLLDLGADDFVSKPFSVMELNARINAVLRRYKTSEKKDNLCFLDITLYKESYMALKNGIDLNLTKKEFLILWYLLENKNRIIKREKLLDIAWGSEYIGESRTLDVHIASLRAKLENECIKTIRGIGYKLEVKNEI